jgi:elongation factor G
VNEGTSRGVWFAMRATRMVCLARSMGWRIPPMRMMQTLADKTRNLGIIAHIDAGKTTTTERMLYYSGLTSHIGDVDQGDTVMDYLPAERARGITITSAAITFNWADHKINLIDTPGHADFTFEVIRSIRVLDGAITILDGVAGVEAQTEKVWHQARQMHIPNIIYVNKMDRPGAGFGRTVREVVAKLNTRVAIINLPYFSTMDDGSSESQFVGVLDVIEQKIIIWEPGSDGKQVDVKNISQMDSSIRTECANARTALIETLSELDDELLETVLELDDYMNVPSKAIKKALRKATVDEQICPVLCGASFKNIGVQPLLEAVIDYLPSPRDRPPPHAISKAQNVTKGRKQHKQLMTNERDVVLDPSNNPLLTCALAFKVVNDPMRGILVFVRVYSGTLHQGSVIFNTANGKKERVTKLLQMQADNPLEVSKIENGNIGVIAGSKEIRTGETIVAHALKKDGINSLAPKDLGLHLHPIDVPPPVFFASITPLSISDARGMEEALEVLLREDPSLRLMYDEDSDQTLLSGMGELHLEIANDRLIKDLKARVRIGDIMISYKETILTSTATVEEEVLDQSGLSVKVRVSVQPLTDDEYEGRAELIHHDEHYVIFPESVEHAVLKMDDIWESIRIGVTPAFARGGKIARLPLHSVCVQVHNVEISPEATSVSGISTAVRVATQRALDSLMKHDYCVMEPIMDVRVMVNDEDIGHVVNDISGNRRGHILSLGEHDHSIKSGEELEFKELASRIYVPTDYTMYMSKHQARTTSQQTIIRAHIPLRKMLGYLTSLRSMTQGRATFLMTFEKFEVVSTDVVDEITSQL